MAPAALKLRGDQLPGGLGGMKYPQRNKGVRGTCPKLSTENLHLEISQAKSQIWPLYIEGILVLI